MSKKLTDVQGKINQAHSELVQCKTNQLEQASDMVHESVTVRFAWGITSYNEAVSKDLNNDLNKDLNKDLSNDSQPTKNVRTVVQTEDHRAKNFIVFSLEEQDSKILHNEVIKCSKCLLKSMRNCSLRKQELARINLELPGL